MGPNAVIGEFAGQIAAELDEFCRSTVERVCGTEYPDDMFRLADRLGMEIIVDGGESHRARCLRIQRGEKSQWLLIVRDEPRWERMQWAIAHELGESLAGQAIMKLGWDVEDLQPVHREWLANEIAKRLLLPFPEFLSEGAALEWDLYRLKEQYPNASHEVIARRMLDAPRPIVITIFDNGRLYWRKSNSLIASPPLTQQEKACWRAAHETGQSVRYQNAVESIVCWTIHENGWQREILRTESPWLEE
ncbi:MAG: ImmA/IrrE family metallo-endopeptidase [Thermogutta sp.]|nr:ImmA/IrrE family metallo-endopeptidase [Thermogutta sp.]HPU07293.1 ImmA/IrrE family metallo-endopeptidase [Thermogutta sp.]HQF12543.1 ImmA/IrrE family metallo-endopeptidase [Thermogutta sp.]